MVFESYPQMVLSIFIMQSLQITELFNIGSCIISTFSVVYGYAELLVLLFHDNDINYPFSKTMWGMAALLIDTLLRWSTRPLVFGCWLLDHLIYLKLRNKRFLMS